MAQKIPELIAFKNVDNIRDAIKVVACDEGHGNVSRIIMDRLKADPAISRAIKKLSKKVVK